MGLDRNMRDQYQDHPHYARTLEFIEKYDAPAFDPEKLQTTMIIIYLFW